MKTFEEFTWKCPWCADIIGHIICIATPRTHIIYDGGEAQYMFHLCEEQKCAPYYAYKLSVEDKEE